jgi:hypothetical protein
MFEGFKASPACPSDSSSINRKMSMEHWWNDADRGRQKYWDRKPVPVLLYPTQIPHELTWHRICASAVGDRPIAAWAMARPPFSSVVLSHHIADVIANTQIYLQYVRPTITNMYGNHSSYTCVLSIAVQLLNEIRNLVPILYFNDGGNFYFST